MKYSEFLRANPSLSDSHSTRKMFLFPFDSFLGWVFNDYLPSYRPLRKMSWLQSPCWIYFLFPPPFIHVNDLDLRLFFRMIKLRRRAGFGSESVRVFHLKDLVLSIN